jgi:hypothetical protein
MLSDMAQPSTAILALLARGDRWITGVSHNNAHILTPRADKPFVLAPGVILATRIELALFIIDAVSLALFLDSRVVACEDGAY